MLKSLITKICLPAVLLVTIAAPAWAKRAPAPVVQPIVVRGVKYVIPNTDGTIGRIQAYNAKTNKLVGEKVLYNIKLQPNLETDVQWVFIKSMQRQGNRLLIVNEKGEKFTLRLR
jgi:hypothetical protein